MKKTLLVSLLCLAVTGCSGLNVSWEVVATYNTPHSVPGTPVAAPKEAAK